MGLDTVKLNGEHFTAHVEQGAQVKKGQLLYKLDSVQYEAAVKGAEAKVAECKARDTTYAAPLRVTARLLNNETGEINMVDINLRAA